MKIITLEQNQKNDFYDNDGHCLPLSMVEELFTLLPYGSPLSIWIKVLQQTGCRMKETDYMRYSYIKDGVLFWKLGKNQKGYFRKEQLSPALLAEIELMRQHTRIMGDCLFPAKAETFGRYYRKFIFPFLSSAWHEKREVLRPSGFASNYRYQLKGFRKNFQTILFYHYWKEYNDAGVGLELVSKRMKHSSTGMTIRHYIENVNQLGVNNLNLLLGKTPGEWIRTSPQKKLFEYNNLTMDKLASATDPVSYYF